LPPRNEQGVLRALEHILAVLGMEPGGTEVRRGMQVTPGTDIRIWADLPQ